MLPLADNGRVYAEILLASAAAPAERQAAAGRRQVTGTEDPAIRGMFISRAVA
jgi:hypothetical protein